MSNLMIVILCNMYKEIKFKLNMKTHRNSNTEGPEQNKKKKKQLNHDRSDLRQPGMDPC